MWQFDPKSVLILMLAVFLVKLATMIRWRLLWRDESAFGEGWAIRIVMGTILLSVMLVWGTGY